MKTKYENGTKVRVVKTEGLVRIDKSKDGKPLHVYRREYMSVPLKVK